MAQSPAQPSAAVDAALTRHGGLSYLEIPAADLLVSVTFYQRVLGWAFHGVETGTAKFSDGPGLLIGRLIPGRPVSREPGIMNYFYVSDIRAAVVNVTVSGGQVVKPPSPEGNLLVASVYDPAGNLIGLWQAGA